MLPLPGTKFRHTRSGRCYVGNGDSEQNAETLTAMRLSAEYINHPYPVTSSPIRINAIEYSVSHSTT
jgi:hypothetical protein